MYGAQFCTCTYICTYLQVRIPLPDRKTNKDTHLAADYINQERRKRNIPFYSQQSDHYSRGTYLITQIVNHFYCKGDKSEPNKVVLVVADFFPNGCLYL